MDRWMDEIKKEKEKRKKTRVFLRHVLCKFRKEKTDRNNYTGLSIDRLVNVAAYTGTYAISEKITFSRILYAVQSLHGGSSSIVKILFPVLSSSPLFSHPSVAVSVIAHFRLVSPLLQQLEHRKRKRESLRSRNTRLNKMKTRGEGKKSCCCLFSLSLSLSLFSLFAATAGTNDCAIVRNVSRTIRMETILLQRVGKREKRNKKRKKARKEEKREAKKKKGGRKKKIKFKRFPIEPREAKTSSHHSRCIPRCNGNTHDKKFINFVLVFRSWGVLVDAAVEEVVRRRVPLHTHGKAGPVVPLSICSNDERMTLRRERSTDFLREARFGRSRVSRRIGTKVSANYILSRVPRERVVIAN